METQNVTAKLGYLKWQDLYNKEKPFELHIDLPDDVIGMKQTNCDFIYEPQPIRDVRGSEDKFSLDNNGFMYLKHQSPYTVDDLRNRDVIVNKYLPETEALMKENVWGIDRIFFFDWRVSLSKGKDCQSAFDFWWE